MWSQRTSEGGLDKDNEIPWRPTWHLHLSSLSIGWLPLTSAKFLKTRSRQWSKACSFWLLVSCRHQPWEWRVCFNLCLGPWSLHTEHDLKGETQSDILITVWFRQVYWANTVLVMHARLLSHFSHVWLFATVWTITHKAPLSLRFSRQEHWSGLPCPPPGHLPDPGIQPTLFCLLH